MFLKRVHMRFYKGSDDFYLGWRRQVKTWPEGWVSTLELSLAGHSCRIKNRFKKIGPFQQPKVNDEKEFFLFCFHNFFWGRIFFLKKCCKYCLVPTCTCVNGLSTFSVCALQNNFQHLLKFLFLIQYLVKKLISTAGLPDFSWYVIPKWGNIYQITRKYTKRPYLNIPNGRKIDQMSRKYTNISIARPSKIYPNWDFWLENIPSGNPDLQTTLLPQISFIRRETRTRQKSDLINNIFFVVTSTHYLFSWWIQRT
jgi:hypothetical protein